MLKAIVAALCGLAISGTAQAASYEISTTSTFTQKSFTLTPDPNRSGYYVADTKFEVMNNGPTSQAFYLLYYSTTLNGENAIWSSTEHTFRAPDYTSTPFGNVVYAAYEDVHGYNPAPAGYMPGGTVPLFSAGTINAGQSNTLDILRETNATGIYSSIYIVSSDVPEPATWAMMILGMSAIGFAMRRRTTATRVSVAI